MGHRFFWAASQLILKATIPLLQSKCMKQANINMNNEEPTLTRGEQQPSTYGSFYKKTFLAQTLTYYHFIKLTLLTGQEQLRVFSRTCKLASIRNYVTGQL